MFLWDFVTVTERHLPHEYTHHGLTNSLPDGGAPQTTNLEAGGLGEGPMPLS